MCMSVCACRCVCVCVCMCQKTIVYGVCLKVYGIAHGGLMARQIWLPLYGYRYKFSPSKEIYGVYSDLKVLCLSPSQEFAFEALTRRRACGSFYYAFCYRTTPHHSHPN